MTRCCGTGRPALSTMWAYIRVRKPLAVGACTRVLPSRVSKPAISSGPYRYVRTPPGSVRTSRDEARDAADAAGAPQKTRSSAVAAVALHLTERHYSSPDRTRNARARTAPRTKKARRGGPFLHAPKRTRTSTRLSRTRPSTWRVYQFRHRREGDGEYSPETPRVESVRQGRYLVRTHVRRKMKEVPSRMDIPKDL